ncbi:MAG: hypothetical protein J7454_12295, partial [Roseiflexus sp.]|nr:hypothetical protein [Roseiflexus sp.]
PVCGFSELDQPPWDPHTGRPVLIFARAADVNLDMMMQRFRRRKSTEWIRQGAVWFEPKLKPAEWDLRKQLRRIGVDLDSGTKQ